jgi:hypothetical protein
METIVPAPLLGLPEPWRNLKSHVKKGLAANDATRGDALRVLDRCLQAVEELPDVSPDEFPDFVTVAWSLWASSFATLMPSFDEFRPEPIAEVFRKQDPNVTDAFVRRYAQAWLREQALWLADDADFWLFYSLRESPHAETLNNLRGIAERHWRADPGKAFSLLHHLWLLDKAGARALLERVAASPDAPPWLAADLTDLLRQ